MIDKKDKKWADVGVEMERAEKMLMIKKWKLFKANKKFMSFLILWLVSAGKPPKKCVTRCPISSYPVDGGNH